MNRLKKAERSLNHVHKEYKTISVRQLLKEVILKSCEATRHVNSRQILVAYRDGGAISPTATAAQQNTNNNRSVV